jgi:hypothetical protein
MRSLDVAFLPRDLLVGRVPEDFVGGLRRGAG